MSTQIWGENPYNYVAPNELSGWISRNVGLFVFLIILIIAIITGGVVGFYCYRKRMGPHRGKSFTSNAHKGEKYKLATDINRDYSVD